MHPRPSRHRHAPPLALALTLGPLCFTADAQNSVPPERNRGMAGAWAAGVTLGSANDEVLLMEPGSAIPPLAPWAPRNGTTPDFTFATSSFDAQHPFQLAPTRPDLNAVSTGRSLIARHNGDGYPRIPANYWLATTISVANGSNGDPESLFSRMNGLGGDTGSELVSHYIDPTGVLDPDISGLTLLENSRLELGFGLTSGDDVNGLDYALGITTVNQWTPAVPFFSGAYDSFFFSVSRTWSDANPSLPFSQDELGNWAVPNPGHIYRMKWDAAEDEWLVPEVYASSYDLLGSETPIDIDALDIDQGREVVVFSTTLSSGLSSQLMIYQAAKSAGPYPAGYTAVPLRDDQGNDITTEADITSNDEVDAVCTFDPESSNLCYQLGAGLDLPSWTNDPVWGSLWVGEKAGLSVMRTEGTSGNPLFPDSLALEVSGWGDIGHGPIIDTKVQFWVEIGGIYAPASPWLSRGASDEVFQYTYAGLPALNPSAPPVAMKVYAILEADPKDDLVIVPTGFPQVTNVVQIRL